MLQFLPKTTFVGQVLETRINYLKIYKIYVPYLVLPDKPDSEKFEVFEVYTFAILDAESRNLELLNIMFK